MTPDQRFALLLTAIGIAASSLGVSLRVVTRLVTRSMRRLDATADVVLGYTAPDGSPIPGISQRFEDLKAKNTLEHMSVTTRIDALAQVQTDGQRAAIVQRSEQNAHLAGITQQVTDLSTKVDGHDQKLTALVNTILNPEGT